MTRKARTILRVLAVDQDSPPLDCCDDDLVHAWVIVTGWNPRRAYLVQGSQFAKAAGCEPSELPGMRFVAELDLDDPPSSDLDPGERIEFLGLGLAPELPEEWIQNPRRENS